MKRITRCFLSRDINTGAFDEENIFYYSNDETAFSEAYQRLKNISPILKFGSYQLNII